MAGNEAYDLHATTAWKHHKRITAFQLIAQTSSAGQSLAYGWYNTGRLATMTDNAGTPPGHSSANVDSAYTWDAEGNCTWERMQGTAWYYDPYGGYASSTVTWQEGRGAWDGSPRSATRGRRGTGR